MKFRVVWKWVSKGLFDVQITRRPVTGSTSDPITPGALDGVVSVAALKKPPPTSVRSDPQRHLPFTTAHYAS